MINLWANVGILLLLLWSGGASARELAPAARLAESFEMRAYAPDVLPGADLSAAMRVQDSYIQLLMQSRGDIIGYKAGLTSPAAQRRFGVDHPLLGFLLRDMLLQSPARLSMQDGARLLVEVDLLLRVGNKAINDARNWPELLRAVDAVIPFVEVPDLLYAHAVRIDAPLLQAANVGARWGVLGAAIPLHAGEDWQRRLAEFKVSLQAGQGEIATGQGRDLLGHPLAVVEWLRDAIQARDRQLLPGDLLSLGSLTPLYPAQPGQLRAIYTGLDPAGPVTVELEFISGAVAPITNP